MTKTRKRFCPAAGLAVLTAAALVLWGGATLWLQGGWGALTPTLVNESADASPLEGFTLSGQMTWYGGYDLLHFTLQDGTIHAEMQLDAPANAVELGRNARYWSFRSCVVPPEDRDAVNEAAAITGSSSDGSRYITAPADRVLRMYTLHLPDETILRLRAGEMALEEGASVFASLPAQTRAGAELNTDYDYSYIDAIPELNPAEGSFDPGDDADWPYDPTSGGVFVLGAGYGLCWSTDYLGKAPGLYRAQGLTADEIAALPRDGVLYDREVLCASTELGTLEPFYCPADAEQALAGVAMADGSTLLIYRTAEGTLCADLVNAAGSPTDHRELATLDGWTENSYATLLPRTTDGEALLKLYTDGIHLVLLRAENGRFTLAKVVEDKDYIDPDAVVLNAAGDKMLLAQGQSIQVSGGAILFGPPSTDGIALRVCEVDTGRVSYLGHIETGSERDWARYYQTRNLHADRWITFDTLQKDGGLLP